MIWKCPSCHPHQCEKTHRQPRLFLGHWIINSFEFLAKRRPKKISFSIFTDENPMRKSNLYLNRKSWAAMFSDFQNAIWWAALSRDGRTSPYLSMRHIAAFLLLFRFEHLKHFTILLNFSKNKILTYKFTYPNSIATFHLISALSAFP